MRVLKNGKRHNRIWTWHFIWAFVLSALTSFLIGLFPLETGHADPAVARNPAKAYLPDPVADTVNVFDLKTHRVIKTIALDSSSAGRRDDPRSVATSPDGLFAYFTNHLSASVTVIDTLKDEAVQRIDLPLPGPGNIAMAPDGSALFIPHYSEKAVTALQIPGYTTRVFKLEDFPGDVAVTPDGGTVLVTGRDSDSLLAIDILTGRVSSVQVGRNPVAIGLTQDGLEAYVSHDNAREVYVVDLTTAPFVIKRRVDVGATGGAAVAVTPDGRYVFVAHCCANSSVSVIAIETKELECHLSLAPEGLDPVRILFTPDGSEAIVINSRSKNISVIRPPCGTPVAEQF